MCPECGKDKPESQKPGPHGLCRECESGYLKADVTKVKKYVFGPAKIRQVIEDGKKQGKSEMSVISELTEGGVRNDDAIRYMEELGFYKTVDQSYAGEPPVSLLSRQDLEGNTTKSFETKKSAQDVLKDIFGKDNNRAPKFRVGDFVSVAGKPGGKSWEVMKVFLYGQDGPEYRVEYQGVKHPELWNSVAPVVPESYLSKSIVEKGQEGVDFGTYYDSAKRKWYVAQIGTGKRLYECGSQEEARAWGLKNAKAGVYSPKSMEKAMGTQEAIEFARMMAAAGKTKGEIYKALVLKGASHMEAYMIAEKFGKAMAKDMGEIFQPHEDVITELMSLHGLDQVTASNILSTVLTSLSNGMTKTQIINKISSEDVLGASIGGSVALAILAILARVAEASQKKSETKKASGRNCDNCGHHLEDSDFDSRGSWNYTCPSCGFHYNHSKDLDDQLEAFDKTEGDSYRSGVIEKGQFDNNWYCDNCGWSGARSLLNQGKCPKCGNDEVYQVRTKGQMEAAKKDLIDAAEDTDSKKMLAAKIKSAQEKIQNATIAEREKSGEARGKSFADGWKALKKATNDNLSEAMQERILTRLSNAEHDRRYGATREDREDAIRTIQEIMQKYPDINSW